MRRALVALLAFAALAGTCGPALAAPSRVVLVTIDGLDAGELPAPGSGPALEALAARGMRARRVCSPSTLPFPALAEVLSGCGPERTQVRDEATRGLPAGVPTLAAGFRAAGYGGLALPADPLAHAHSGLARGFERWSAVSPALADSARVDSALAWLGAGGRRFVWLAFSFGPPAEVWRRGDGIGPGEARAFHARALEIDAALARLEAGLARDGAAAPSLVAVCGTCARAGGPAGSPSVPFFMAGPGIPEGRTLRGSARLADVTPTLLAAAGLTPRGFGGSDLLAPGRSAAARACPEPDAGVRGERSAIAVPESCAAELRTSLARAGAPDSAALVAWVELCRRAPTSLRLELERAVAISHSGHEKVAAEAFKRIVGTHPEYPEAAIAYAEHLLHFQRNEVVPPVLAGIAPDSPLAALAAWRVALAYAGELDFIAAIGAAERAAAMCVPAAGALGAVATLRGLEAMSDSSRREGAPPEVRLRFGRALAEFGLYEAAYPQFHAARARMPGSAEPDYWLADALARQGRTANAESTLTRAIRTDPGHRPSRLALADALLALDRRKEAREQLERALAIDPRDARAQYNLACLRATEGDIAGALDALERAVQYGYADRERLEGDPDLARLRDEPRYRKLLAPRD